MKIRELREKILSGALRGYADIYPDCSAAEERFVAVIDGFAELYGEDREAVLLSAPGRSELIGNHTDHNGGRVIAGAVTRDIIAVAARRDDGKIRLKSAGRDECVTSISESESRENYEKYSSTALIGGVVARLREWGYGVGGFDAYTSTEVLSGSGLSSSAAFEVMVGNILNHLYLDGAVTPAKLAMAAQYAENEYFGKPSGLMDQLASAVGGFVFMDFEKSGEPRVTAIKLSLSALGYALCVVNTRGSHADLNDEYAAVPREMREVAGLFGREVLRGITERELLLRAEEIRSTCGDRAFLRALHFVREDLRAESARAALTEGDIDKFFELMRESGDSSYKYLQNIYAPKNPKEQGLSVALSLTDGFLGKSGAYRVQGGGFAGTIEAIVPKERVGEYTALMDGVFGKGAVMTLDVRAAGAIRLF